VICLKVVVYFQTHENTIVTKQKPIDSKVCVLLSPGNSFRVAQTDCTCLTDSVLHVDGQMSAVSHGFPWVVDVWFPPNITCRWLILFHHLLFVIRKCPSTVFSKSRLWRSPRCKHFSLLTLLKQHKNDNKIISWIFQFYVSCMYTIRAI